MTETAATFIPISYNVLAFFSFSQFISRTILAPDIPNICVCTAPETPTVHKSELAELIEGAIADGGGELTVVSDVLLLLIVLSVVLSVTIGSASAMVDPMKGINNKNRKSKCLDIMFIPY
jgi:hypothetical protein